MNDAVEKVRQLWVNNPDPIISRSWAFQPAPKNDELLSSWFLRTASGLELKPYSLAHMTWGSNPPLLTRDIDNMADPRVVGGMAAKTATPASRAWATTLASYDGYLTSDYHPGGRNPWILPIGIRHRLRNRTGLQFCPFCLADSGYYRRAWRLGFVTCCLIHLCRLNDCCPDCRAPLEPHRSPEMHACARCGCDLRKAPTFPAKKRPLELQRHALVALRRGWGALGHTVLGWSHLYFEILRLVAKALAVGQRALALRHCVARKFGGDPTPFEFQNLREIEMLNVADRHRLLDLVGAVIGDWPKRLIETCKEAHVWRSWFIRDCEHVPFEIAQITDQHLTLREYQPDLSEVSSAWYTMRQKQKHVSKKTLVRLLGDCQAVDEFFCNNQNPDNRPPS